jgi:hypothetical protein
VIIANADKNLGPVGINVEHYIKLGLDHLLDPSTYVFLTKDQADQDIHDLGLAIHAWTVRHRCLLPNDTVYFIQEHMGKASKKPLRYSISSLNSTNFQLQDAPSVLTAVASQMPWAAMWILHCN